MSLIKQVGDLKASGRSDSQIVSDLRNQGFMPREIEDALSQFAVKSAVSGEYGGVDNSSDSNMQQSIMTQQVPNQQQGFSAPSPSNFSPPPVPAPIGTSNQNPDYGQAPGQSDQNYYEGYSSPASDSYPQYSYSPASSSESFSEIAEQVFDQKIVKIKSELSKLDDFRADTDGKLSLIRERLKRIESIIDTLQDSIIKKIGEYGQNIQDLGSDLRATQDSFSKMVTPLSSKINLNSKKVSSPKARKKRSKRSFKF